MKEMTRTLIFVVVAGVSIALATVTHFATKPKPLTEFEAVGTEFYPEFTDPVEAKALTVVAYDEDTATVKEFSVKFKDGRWRIPSHHNYPADAKDRLYKTAASVVGIVRGALADRQASSHEKYGVIDPTDENVTSLKGRGQRITLTKEDGSTLADYIIGKKVEGESEGSRYYVRKPKEEETYITELDIDLSTKFSDWIESDLLKLDSYDLAEIVVNKYSIDENRGAIVNREISKLNREKSGDPWKLDGLNEETEEVNKDNVREMVNGLGDLKIVGVRPKPGGLKPDLSIDPKFVRNQLEFNILRSQMAAKGFILASAPGEEKKLHLYSDEGELVAATDKGLVYNLRFGKIFTGTEFEIEVGFASDKADKKDEKKDHAEATNSDKNKKQAKGADDGQKQKKKDAEKGDEKEKSSGDSEDGDKKKGEDLKKNRYLFVTAKFDEKYLGDKPEKPVEPKKPVGPPKPEDAKKADSKKKENADGSKPNKSSDAASDKGDSGGGEAAEKDDAKNSEKSDSAEKKDGKEKDKEKKDDSEKKGPQAEYEKAKKKYDDDLKKYEDDQKNYEKKIEDGKKKVKELNDRFAGWYYVISAESFENLRLARKDLVKPKEKKEEEKSDEDKKSEKKKPGDTLKPAAAKKPAPQKKPETAKKPAAKKPSEAEKKPDSPKPKTEKPPESKQPASPPK